MNLLNYYRATFPGEIFEKIKRKLLILAHLFSEDKKKEFKNILISKYFYLNKNKKQFKNLGEDFKIFNFRIDLLKQINWEILKVDENKEWFKVKISDYGDIKYTWEIGRLQFLLPLAISGKEERGVELLDSWIEKNKFLKGPNWCSNLEVAIRSISILNFLIFVNDIKLLEKYKKCLYQHARYIYKEIFYTEKCIPNNHLVGEAAALYCLSRFFESDEVLKWENKARSILKKYINHIRKDGSYLEASLSYQRFFLQMYIMVYLYSKKTQDNFLEEEIKYMIKRSYTFLKSIEKPNSEYPNFGDNDEGYFYKVFCEEPYNSFVDNLVYILGDSKKKKSNELQFLFENIYNIKIKGNKKLNSDLRKKYFSEGKYFVYKKNKNYMFVNNQEQVYHSHSDGLSVELMLEGKNIFVDSGTFNYNLDQKKRRYYRGTTSHNTILLNKSDQTTQVGSFRWVKQAETKLKFIELNENFFEILGELETKNKAKHIREIKLNKEFTEIEIVDRVENIDSLELNWHFSRDIQLKKIASREYKILGIDYRIRFQCYFDSEIIMTESLCSLGYNEEHLRKNLKIFNKQKKNMYIIKTFIKRDENESSIDIWN